MLTFGKLGASLVVLATMAGGSTCRGQGEGGGEVPREASVARDVQLPGVDTGALTPRERNEWAGYVSEFLAPCADTPVPIAQCVKENRNCSRCLPAAKYLLKGVRDGQSREQIEKSFANRFDAKKVKDVPIEGSPSKGPESAPIVIVEFADFECPFCASMAPVFEKVFTDHQPKVRFVFKYMPLPGHPHGEIAARAGFAAQVQGKFWEMNKKMFANRDHLEQSDLESYARELGLDVAKFKADMLSPAATERLATDRKLADALGVKGTPSVYLNGREVDLRQDLGEWIALELQMAAEGSAKAPAPTPAPSGSAKVDAAAAPVASGSARAGGTPSATASAAPPPKKAAGKP